MEFDTDTRKVLEDVLHFLHTINGGMITTDGEPFRLDASDYIADIQRVLPPGPYIRPAD